MPETLTQLKQKTDVREALAQTGGKPKIKAQTRDKFWFGTHILVLLGCAAVSLLLGLKWIPLPQIHLDVLQRATRATVFIVVVLAIAKAISVYGIGRIEDASTTFTLRRILKLVTAIVIVFIGLSIFFANWYTALISVGVVSIVVGLSVQTPMSSFIGWIYILVRRPYRVGDRIKIGDATGDVIDVSYIDTTLWEFGGSFLSTDHPTGRVIKFPNAKVLDTMVYNYSWPLFPYVWNEIKFQIAYQSDLQFVAQTMERIVEEEIGEEMQERVSLYRDLLAKTPVNELEVRAHPRVFFRVDELTWIDAIVRYVVPPREAGSIKTRLIPKLLAALNAEPNKVMFPAGNAR
ncbi:MAG TPA: mechanosensitive ion channel family protein [Chthoniobacterales bacterium]|nr:mechanosensitive ion channel family protein [Chthoniobacterales bacterium]